MTEKFKSNFLEVIKGVAQVEEVNTDQELFQDLGLDSLDTIDTLMKVEEKNNVVINDMGFELSSQATVGEFMNKLFDNIVEDGKV